MEFNFEELKVYQKALDFVDEIYKLTKNFPKDELYGLTSQVRRASTSIALNISEGSGKSNKEFARFVIIARGSVFECFTILKISLNLKVIDQKQFLTLKNKLIELSKMLISLKNSLITHNSRLITHNL